MNTKENGTNRQAGAALDVKHGYLTTHRDVSQVKQQQFVEAIKSINMGDYMPVTRI